MKLRWRGRMTYQPTLQCPQTWVNPWSCRGLLHVCESLSFVSSTNFFNSKISTQRSTLQLIVLGTRSDCINCFTDALICLHGVWPIHCIFWSIELASFNLPWWLRTMFRPLTPHNPMGPRRTFGLSCLISEVCRLKFLSWKQFSHPIFSLCSS